MLQEVELLIKWLLLKAWESGAAEQKGAELLKETRPHSDRHVEIAGLPGGCSNCCRGLPCSQHSTLPSYIPGFFTGHAQDLSCPLGLPVEPPSGSEAS